MIRTFAVEVRDDRTFIPVIATLLESQDEQERWLINRSGYRGQRYLLVTSLVHLETCDNPYRWNNVTLRDAHIYMLANIDALLDGSLKLVDCEFIRGDRDTPRKSERFD